MLEEVMEGLYPYHGNQRIRDRWHIHPIKNNDLLNIKVTDMNGGLDITNSQGTLGTVLLEPNRFTFVTWMQGFNWNSYEKEIRVLIKKYGDSVSKERKALERLEKQRARRRNNPNAAELQSRIRESRQKVEQEESNMAKSCEIYNRLITEWKNN